MSNLPELSLHHSTIFVGGGEYVDRASYIQQRDEASRLRERCMGYEAKIERLTADCEMKDKRIDWTVSDNVKKALEIERLEAALAKSCEEGRAEMYDCGFNGLKAEIERLEAALQSIARREVPDASAHGQVLVARAALEGGDE